MTAAETSGPGPCLPTTVWFLVSEDGDPLGQTYAPAPEVGQEVRRPEAVAGWVVVTLEELRAACAMRRFRVVIRPPG